MKKNRIKSLMFVCFCVLFLNQTIVIVFADEIANIRGLYAEINKVIEKNNTKEIYLELTSQGWKKFTKPSSKAEVDMDLIQTAKGYMMNARLLKATIVIGSPSGDWQSTTDYYFHENGKTAFIFENYSTHQGYNFDKEEDLPPGPYIIEKRLYFDEKGQEIKSLTKSYVKSNKKEILIKYIKKNQFDIYNSVKNLPFYTLLQ